MFYSYFYLDPRCPGKYEYPEIDLCFLFEPIYVGKGSGGIGRAMCHLKHARKRIKKLKIYDGNNLKINKIVRILKEDKEPYVLIIPKNTNESALCFESQCISIIGRLDLKTGPLTNLTGGGEGNIPGPITREKQRAVKMGTKRPLIERLERSLRMMGKDNHFFGKKHSKQSLEKISISRKGKRAGEDHPFFGKTHTPEVRKIISVARKKLTGDKATHANRWKVISPNNEVFIFRGGFNNFCIEHNIKSPQLLGAVAKGKRDNYKGWKCEYINDICITDNNE